MLGQCVQSLQEQGRSSPELSPHERPAHREGMTRARTAGEAWKQVAVQGTEKPEA